MNNKNEIKALQSILLCSNSLNEIKKGSLVSGMFYLLAGIGIIALLLLVIIKDLEKISHYFLFGLSGFLLALAYVKYTEKVGIEFIANYFDYNKVKNRLLELDVESEELMVKVDSPYKNIVHYLAWAAIGIVILVIKNNFG